MIIGLELADGALQDLVVEHVSVLVAEIPSKMDPGGMIQSFLNCGLFKVAYWAVVFSLIHRRNFVIAQ